MEQEEDDNICDGVIYTDPGRRFRLSTRGGYLRSMHIIWGFLSGVTIWGYNLRGVNLQGVISGIRCATALPDNKKLS